jgi:hypothetical protein
MVMENKHMVDGDDVDDNGGEDGIEITLSSVESRTPETKIIVVAVLYLVKSSFLLGG